jgi:hypothetical protein
MKPLHAAALALEERTGQRKRREESRSVASSNAARSKGANTASAQVVAKRRAERPCQSLSRFCVWHFETIQNEIRVHDFIAKFVSDCK